MKVEHVFVYGTLRVGQGAYRGYKLDTGTDHIGTFDHPGTIFSLGGFPGVRLNGDGRFVGDLLRLHRPEAQLAALDQYEGEGSLYHRRVIYVGPDKVPAYAYEYNGPSRTPIDGGDWIKYIRAV